MLRFSSSFQILKLHNWFQYQNTIWIKAFNMTTQQQILEEPVSGKIIDNCLVLKVNIPFDCSCKNQISLRFNMYGGTLLGYTIVNTHELENNVNKFLSLYSSGNSVVEITRRKQRGRDNTNTSGRQMRTASSYSKNQKYGFAGSLENLNKKFKKVETNFLQSINQYALCAEKVDKLSSEMNEIKRKIRAKSNSKSKLESLRIGIQSEKLNFHELVEPYLKHQKHPSMQRKYSNSLHSNQSQPSLLKKNTASTLSQLSTQCSQTRNLPSK